MDLPLRSIAVCDGYSRLAKIVYEADLGDSLDQQLVLLVAKVFLCLFLLFINGNRI